MRCTHRGRALAAPALMLVSLLSACSDAPTSPAVSRSPEPRRPLASLGSYTDGSSLTVWDAAGTGYTVIPSLSEIHTTNGYVFVLNASELADAMTAFVAAYEGDRAANALASAPPPRSGCGPVITDCPPEYAYSLPGGAPAPIPYDGVSPLPPPSVGGLLVRRADRVAPAALPTTDFDGAGLQYVGSCADIAGAIYDATLQHRSSRNAVLDVLKGALAVRVAAAYESGLKVSLANIQGLGFKLETAAHEQLSSTTQLNILATLYSAYGCWGGSWGSAGSVGGSYFPPPAPVYKLCHRETWEVSTDGGGSWAPQEVTVCEYYMD